MRIVELSINLDAFRFHYKASTEKYLLLICVLLSDIVSSDETGMMH